MSSRPRKQSRPGRKQHGRKRSPRKAPSSGFWRSPAGRVATGLAVLVVLAAAVDRFLDSRQPPPAPDRTALDRTVALPPLPELAPPEPDRPLSRDPGVRLPETQAWLKNAVAAAPPDGRPMIAVVIDDVGLDRPRSRRAMALPPPLTIALMAYAEAPREQAAEARRAGHELLVHLPMEPGDPSVDPGPNALLSGLSKAEFERRLGWDLSRFGGYVGINNHMGSKLTGDPAALAPVMAVLKRRGLLFLDSRTSSSTRGLEVARQFGVPAVERDIFLDHDNSPIAVRAALVRVEDLAQRNGFAIAIGHPRDATLDALEEWLPDVKARGFALVPLTAIVRYTRVDG